MDKSKDIRFVFCYISKAFDKVWHNRLLFKLQNYRVAGNVLSWIEHYLTYRNQKIVVEGFSSSFKSINAGSPSGFLCRERAYIGFILLPNTIYVIWIKHCLNKIWKPDISAQEHSDRVSGPLGPCFSHVSKVCYLLICNRLISISSDRHFYI